MVRSILLLSFRLEKSDCSEVTEAESFRARYRHLRRLGCARRGSHFISPSSNHPLQKTYLADEIVTVGVGGQTKGSGRQDRTELMRSEKKIWRKTKFLVQTWPKPPSAIYFITRGIPVGRLHRHRQTERIPCGLFGHFLFHGS